MAHLAGGSAEVCFRDIIIGGPVKNSERIFDEVSPNFAAQNLAERPGFEPGVLLRVHTVSNRAQSAALAPLRGDTGPFRRVREYRGAAAASRRGEKHCGLRISDCGLNGQTANGKRQTANGKDQGAMPSEPRPEGRGHVPCPGTCQGEGRTATEGAKGFNHGAGLSSSRRTRRPLD